MSSKRKTVKYGGRKHSVPVDGDGLVPTDYLMTIQSGRSGRSKAADARRRAKVTFPSRPEPLQAVMWRIHPGKFDIEGIDTPVEIPVAIEPVVVPDVIPVAIDPAAVEPIASAPSAPVERPRTKKAKGKGYSASTWKKRKLDFENDPEGASREAYRLMRAETTEATEDMRAYLDDSRYDEFGSTRYRHDDRDLVNDYFSKRWDEFRMYEQPYHNRRAGKNAR